MASDGLEAATVQRGPQASHEVEGSVHLRQPHDTSIRIVASVVSCHGWCVSRQSPLVAEDAAVGTQGGSDDVIGNEAGDQAVDGLMGGVNDLLHYRPVC